MQQTIFERQPPAEALILGALEGSVNKPFWIDDVGEQQILPNLQAEISTDLAIVGGGFLGLWTAILAKERNPAMVGRIWIGADATLTAFPL